MLFLSLLMLLLMIMGGCCLLLAAAAAAAAAAFGMMQLVPVLAALKALQRAAGCRHWTSRSG